MTTDLKHLMREAAGYAPDSRRLLADARAGAHRLQRRRRAVAATTAGTTLGLAAMLSRGGVLSRDGSTGSLSAAAGAAGPVASVDPSRDGSLSVAAGTAAPVASVDPSRAPSSLPDCNSGWGTTPRDVPAADLPLRLLTDDATYQLEWVQAADMTRDCELAPAALVLTAPAADGSVARSVTARGPRRTLSDFSDFMGASRPTTVRGAPGVVADAAFADNSPGMIKLAWTEPGGANWELSGTGVTRRELDAIAAELVLKGETATVRATPPGFTVEPRAVSAQRQNNVARQWMVAYRTGDDRLLLTITDVPHTIGEDAGNGWRFTTVRGHRAQALTKGAHLVAMDWQERPGLTVSVSSENGSTKPTALAAFAESLQPVAASDPRIAAKLRSSLGDESPPATLSPKAP